MSIDVQDYIHARLRHAFRHEMAHQFPLADLHPEADADCSDIHCRISPGTTCWGMHHEDDPTSPVPVTEGDQ